MEIEVVTTSPLAILCVVVLFLGFMGTFMSLILIVMGYLRVKTGLISALIFMLALVGGGFGNSIEAGKIKKNAEDTFNQKLMEEYGATSSRSIVDMRNDFYKYNEATTTFTRDGVDTTVFVKKISDDNNKLKMVFTIVDEKALYPKK
jgi:hypothetical protein